MHVILCDLCMYDHEEKKIVLLAQNVEEEKEEEKRSSESEKKFHYLCPMTSLLQIWPSEKSSNFFLKKNYNEDDK